MAYWPVDGIVYSIVNLSSATFNCRVNVCFAVANCSFKLSNCFPFEAACGVALILAEQKKAPANLLIRFVPVIIYTKPST